MKCTERDKMVKQKHLNVAKITTEILGLGKTVTDILGVISKNNEMLISDIAEKIKKSERSVRKYLKTLVDKGLLERKIEITRNNRLAYKYSMRSPEKIFEILKIDLAAKIDKVESLKTKYWQSKADKRGV